MDLGQNPGSATTSSDPQRKRLCPSLSFLLCGGTGCKARSGRFGQAARGRRSVEGMKGRRAKSSATVRYYDYRDGVFSPAAVPQL